MAAFQAGFFEELHSGPVSLLVSGRGNVREHAAALEELQTHKEKLGNPLVFRGREDTVDLPTLARHILAECPRLVSDQLVRTVDEASRNLRLHQHDCCALVEQAMDMSTDTQDVPRRCAAIYVRECHFQVLCLHDVAQGLSDPLVKHQCVAFFAHLGGPQFVKALLEAVRLLLRDISGERAGDQTFTGFAGAVLPLFVETLLAYCFAFKANAEEAEQVVALLPHVVVAQHAPLGQGFTLSDLDVVPREEYAVMIMKLSLALICMFHPKLGDSIDVSKVPATASPEVLRLEEERSASLPVGDAGGGILSSSTLGAKIKAGDYWSEDNQLGQFLCFMVNGVLLENETALRNGFMHWQTFHFILHEVLLSGSIVGTSSSGRLVFRCLQELLVMALGRRWVAVQKLEAQPVSFRIQGPEALQLAVLRTLNRLCRVHPPACEAFCELALISAEALGPPISASVTSTGPRPQVQKGQHGGAPEDTTVLWAEVLELVATISARGPLHCVHSVSQKLFSHSSQWFSFPSLVDVLLQHARAPRQAALPNRGMAASTAPLAVACCHLLSALCGSRLAVSQPAPQLLFQASQLQGPSQWALGPASAESLGPVLLELLASLPDASVQASALGALSHLSFTPSAAKATFEAVVAMLPGLAAGICDVRNSWHGALAIELLACCLRLVQTIPISRGRYALDLQPLTHLVVFHLLLKVLPSTTPMANTAPRYWRLAALSLRWLHLVMHGPLPLTQMLELNLALLEPYSDSEGVAAEVAARIMSGSATSFVFRCLLSLDSPVFAQVMKLTLLGGRGIEGLVAGQKGAEGPFCEQTVLAGLNIVRLLLQRDVLFRRLYSQQVMGPVCGHSVNLDAGDLLPTQRLLLREYAFTYPPAADSSRGSVWQAQNPFASRRLWQVQADSSPSSGSAGHRTNPSYLVLLAEFVGARRNPEIAKLAIFAFLQTALRDAETSLQVLRLERWRLHCLSADLFERLMQPEEETPLSTAARAHGRWDGTAEEDFMFEVMEMDVTPEVMGAALQLDVASFRTGLPLCHVVDILYQLADDSLTQAADLAAWARSRGGLPDTSGAFSQSRRADPSLEVEHFRSAYLRGLGLGTPVDWLGTQAAARDLALALSSASAPSTTASASAASASAALGPAAPPPLLATVRCRLLALQALLLLLAAPSQGPSASPAVKGRVSLSFAQPAPRPQSQPRSEASLAAASQIAQALLGLEPEASVCGAEVDIDAARAGQPCPLDAVMELLEQPPPLPSLREVVATPAGLSQALEQHAAYESALGIVVGLAAKPALRDVALRFMCHAWPSRYEVLQNLLVLRWSSAPLALRRLLLSELSLLLQLLNWEMRLVPAAGVATGWKRKAEAETLDVAARQRLEMRLAVAEHLQEIVQNLVAAGQVGHRDVEGEGGQAEAGSVRRRHVRPFLIKAALQLADSCESETETETPGQSLTATSLGVEREFFEAAECLCLAPAEDGGLSLCLGLCDPALLMALLGRRRGADLGCLALAELRARNGSACLAFLSRSVFAALGLFLSAVLLHFTGRALPRNLDLEPSAQKEPQQEERPSAVRGQVLRAHLEALLPALSQPRLASCSPARLELLTSLALSLILALQQLVQQQRLQRQLQRQQLQLERKQRQQWQQQRQPERHQEPSGDNAPVARSFLQELFQSFRELLCSSGAALPLPPARHLQQALLLILQSLLPDPWCSGDAGGCLTPSALAKVQQLLKAVLSHARSDALLLLGGSPATAAAEGVGDAQGLGRTGAGACSLPLLLVLLQALPPHQLPEVFLFREGEGEGGAASAAGAATAEGSENWQQLLALLRSIWQQPTGVTGALATEALAWQGASTSGEGYRGPGGAGSWLEAGAGSREVLRDWEREQLRLQSACLVALLCRAPALASALFEAAGLASLLQLDLQGRPMTRDLSFTLSPESLPNILPGPEALGTGMGQGQGHPIRLLLLLEVVVAVVGELSSHRLSLHCVLAWLERQQQPLLELLLRVLHLPLPCATEPAPAAFDTLEGLRTQMVTPPSEAFTPSSSSRASALLVMCRGSPEDDDRTTALVAQALKSIGHSAHASDQTPATALCLQCAVLFAELWASLWVGVSRSASSKSGDPWQGEPIRVSMSTLRQPFEAVLLALLTQMSSVVEPPPGQVSPYVQGSPSAPAPWGQPSVAQNQTGTGAWSWIPSKATRFTVCLQVMRAWRVDGLAQQLKILINNHWMNRTVSRDPSMQEGALYQHLGQVKARTNSLCVLLAHSCEALLGLRVDVSQAQDDCSTGRRCCVYYAGSEVQLRLVLTVIEMVLHLLLENLRALATAAAFGSAVAAAVSGALVPNGVYATSSPVFAAPRPAIIAQYLRSLQRFQEVTGGALAPVQEVFEGHRKNQWEDRKPAALPFSPDMLSTLQVMDLAFATRLAKQVEEQFAELQTL